MAEVNKAKIAHIKNVRLSFPNLRNKKASVPGGKEKFSANFIIDPSTPQGAENIAACKAAIAAAEMEVFHKAGVVKLIEDPKRIALRPGAKFRNAEGEIYAGYENMVGVVCTNTSRPDLVDRHRVEVDLEEIEDKFYGGVYVDAFVDFYCVATKEKGGRGLFCSVIGIKSREKGEPFGGGFKVTGADFDDDDEDDADDGLGTAPGEDEDLLA